MRKESLECRIDTDGERRVFFIPAVDRSQGVHDDKIGDDLLIQRAKGGLACWLEDANRWEKLPPNVRTRGQVFQPRLYQASGGIQLKIENPTSPSRLSEEGFPRSYASSNLPCEWGLPSPCLAIEEDNPLLRDVWINQKGDSPKWLGREFSPRIDH